MCSHAHAGWDGLSDEKQARPLEAAETRKSPPTTPWNSSRSCWAKLLPFFQNVYGGVGRALGIPSFQIPQ